MALLLHLGSVARPSIYPGWAALLLTGPSRLQGPRPSSSVVAALVAAVSVAVAAVVLVLAATVAVVASAVSAVAAAAAASVVVAIAAVAEFVAAAGSALVSPESLSFLSRCPWS